MTQKTFTFHKRMAADHELEINERFVHNIYTNALQQHYHEVVGKSSEELLTLNQYNEIGQLINKKVGNNLQDIDYTYNIRGWLTKINNPDNIGSKLFAYEIKYNNPVHPAISTPKYNGNIAEIDWVIKGFAKKRYSYTYDHLNRLRDGIFQDPDAVVPLSNLYNESIVYDINGNIINLKRNAKHGKYYTPILIDDLHYNYSDGNGNSNRLDSIFDATTNTSGYPGGGHAISYDVNGNMTSMNDKNISAITYNFLNLPTKIKQYENTTNYIYRADGEKLKKIYNLKNAAGHKIIITEYLDGFQYSTPNTEPIRRALEEEDDATLSAVKAGNEEVFLPLDERLIIPNDPTAENRVELSFFPTSEGYYDYENFRYIYQYKDHLGNVRMSYVKNNVGSLEIKDTNDYYPFGLSYLAIGGEASVFDPMAIPYNYKYNGKELQETGMYDYGARFYMPDIGRWGVVDPLAEQTPNWSPYAYGFNNPIRFIDPTGMSNEDFVQRKDGSIYWDNKANDQATTKAGETYLGKNLSFTFNSYIGSNYDGPLGSLPEGDKLTTTINLSASENSAGELTGLSATKTTTIGETFGISFLKGRDYYPGEGGSNNSFTQSGMSVNYEQHASVPKIEETGLNASGFKIVDVAQKLNISFDKSSGNLSVNAYTNVFPSATLKLNNTGTTLMNYKQPSFVGTHTAPIKGYSPPAMGEGRTGGQPMRDFSYYPSRFYKRN